MAQLIVFDLDGTLVDSRLDLAASANRLLEGFGARPLSVARVGSMVGDGARVLVGRVLEAARIDTDLDGALRSFLEIYDSHLLDHTCLYPGVADMLRALHGRASMALLTNKPGHHTERLLTALGVRSFFFEVIGGDGDWPRKPDPAALVHLIEVAGVTAADTIMVGDSMVDVETARRASTRVCAVSYGFGRFDAGLPADAIVVDEPTQLAARLSDALTALE